MYSKETGIFRPLQAAVSWLNILVNATHHSPEQLAEDEAARELAAHFDYRWRPMAKDPSDDHVLETAINGAAHAIATFNVKDYGDAASRFGIIIEQPEKVLRRIKQ